jgi:hemoglobin
VTLQCATYPRGLDPQHFERWLDLFAQTTRETFPAETAARIQEKARRIARNFQDAAAYQKEKRSADLQC